MDCKLYNIVHIGKINQFVLVFVALLVMPIMNLHSQYSVLRDFVAVTGGKAVAAPIYADGKIYGTTSSATADVVYSINTDGSGYTVLVDLTAQGLVDPSGQLLKIGNTLYGTTFSNNSNNLGHIYKIDIDGNNFSIFHNFTNLTGSQPVGGVITDGTYLYGTCQSDGDNGFGTVYKVLPDGTNFSVLLSFDGTNGKNPQGKLLLIDDYLYGVSLTGGANNNGTVFRVHKNTGATNILHSFATVGLGDGSYGSLTYFKGKLVGVTSTGGANGSGALYYMDIDGSNPTVIHDFSDFVNDGSTPYYVEIIYSSEILYGVSYSGGANFVGTIFEVADLAGTSYSVLHSFANASGSNPFSGVVLNGNELYGATYDGGANGQGVIYNFILSYNAPTISSGDVTVTTTTASVPGQSITDGGRNIVKKGVILGNDSSIDLDNNNQIILETADANSFTSIISNLTENTQYYARAFIISEFDTAYGSVKSFITASSSSDSDNDGISNDIENAGPNGGDANNDGTLDSQQDYVNTLYNEITGNYITIQELGNNRVYDISITAQIEENNALNYPFGEISYKVDASVISVKIYFHGTTDLSQYTYRKKSSNGVYAQFDNYIFGTETINGNQVAYAQLELIDGSPFDYDGIVNGVIYDPGGPAIPFGSQIPTLSEWARIFAFCMFLGVSIWWWRRVV